MFEQVWNLLSRVLKGDMRMTSLLRFAESVAAKQRVHLDRSSKRTKDAVICWFCEFLSGMVTQSTERTSVKEASNSNGVTSAEEPPGRTADEFESLLTTFAEQELRNDDWFRSESWDF
jgi:hypothetical protein